MAVIVDGQANTLGVGRRYILVRIDEVVFNTIQYLWLFVARRFLSLELRLWASEITT